MEIVSEGRIMEWEGRMTGGKERVGMLRGRGESVGESAYGRGGKEEKVEKECR